MKSLCVCMRGCVCVCACVCVHVCVCTCDTGLRDFMKEKSEDLNWEGESNELRCLP